MYFSLTLIYGMRYAGFSMAGRLLEFGFEVSLKCEIPALGPIMLWPWIFLKVYAFGWTACVIIHNANAYNKMLIMRKDGVWIGYDPGEVVTLLGG